MLNEGIDPKLFRDNPYAVAAYLSEAFAKNDREAILKAVNVVMRAQNVAAIAREAGLRRERLYKTFGGKTDPPLSRVMALFEALGVRLTVIPVPPRKIPPRPKLGRPKKTDERRLTSVPNRRAFVWEPTGATGVFRPLKSAEGPTGASWGSEYPAKAVPVCVGA